MQHGLFVRAWGSANRGGRIKEVRRREGSGYGECRYPQVIDAARWQVDTIGSGSFCPRSKRHTVLVAVAIPPSGRFLNPMMALIFRESKVSESAINIAGVRTEELSQNKGWQFSSPGPWSCVGHIKWLSMEEHFIWAFVLTHYYTVLYVYNIIYYYTYTTSIYYLLYHIIINTLHYYTISYRILLYIHTLHYYTKLHLLSLLCVFLQGGMQSSFHPKKIVSILRAETNAQMKCPTMLNHFIDSTQDIGSGGKWQPHLFEVEVEVVVQIYEFF